MEWESVIGLEVHIQLLTHSKIFSGSATTYGAEPNAQACAIDLGMPGVLPVLNEAAVHMAVKFGLAVDATITPTSVFARKNYFYPDLPKGYQISQHDLPIVAHGKLFITLEDDTNKTIGITRAHLEEDAGKSIHEGLRNYTGVDLNRAGTPLLEIVSEPELRNAKEAVAYLKALHTLVTYLEICDGNMQEGSFRCDANVSVRPKGQTTLGTRTETKNLNSFRFIERAINYEIARQIEVLEQGGEILQETRLYDVNKDQTRPMRSKENANDYRYFPDPDLLPVVITSDYIEMVRAQLPELPDAKRERLQSQYNLNAYDASVLISNPALANYFEATLTATSPDNAKLVVNWVMGDLSAALNKHNLEITDCPITAEHLAGLIKRIADGTISGKIAKSVFETMWHESKSADEIIQQQGLQQLTDASAIEKIIDSIMASSPQQLEQYRAGKDKLFGYFVGQVMKATEGKANPQQVNELLKEKLK
ncbi:MAG: Asp-tRNA(Asn)/Glu-tRNA(Gln) amidotransferase subunit GatB [Gammaproteobacteria bacterium]